MITRSRLPAVVAAALAVVGCSDGSARPAASSTTVVATSTARSSTSLAADTAPPTTQPPLTTQPSRTYDFAAVHPIVERLVAEHRLNGAGLIVVDRRDGVVHEDYWGEFGPQRISLIASSSKMITAGVLLRLQDDGLIDLNRPVADYVPWGAANPTITTAQLLSNSSGLVGLLPNPGYAPYLCQYMASGTLRDCAETIFTTADDDADVVAADTTFRYGGAQWQVAGAVAEVVTGKPWAQLIDEIYVQPCGLTSLAYNNHFSQLPGGFSYPYEFRGDPAVLQPTDNPNMEGGAYLAPGDYATLLEMLLRRGTCADQRVLSEAAVHQMLTDRVSAYGAETEMGGGYGLGWFIDRTHDRSVDPGAYGSIPWLDLDDGYGAYLVIEDQTTVGLQIMNQIADPIEQAILAGRG